MKVDINAFTGMRPAISTRLLGDSEAQEVFNADLENGDIIPIFKPKFIERKNFHALALWQHDLRHLSGGQVLRTFPERRSFVESPIANDSYARLYMSRNDAGGLLMMDSTGTEYTLGVVCPPASPKVTATALRSGAVTFDAAANTFAFSDTANRHNRPYLVPDEKITFAGTTMPNGVTANTEYAVLQGFATGAGTYAYTFYNPTDTTRAQIAFTTAGSGVTCTAKSEDSLQDRAYVYTMVDAFGQESAPSLPTKITVDASTKVTLGGLDTPLIAGQGYPDYSKKRVYRTATGESGSTSYLYVGEVAASATTFVDALLDEELAEVLPSQGWKLPPSAGKHLVGLPGGIMAAHTSGEVMFSDPYHPYAWPNAYRYTLGGNVLTIAASQNTVFALTDSVVHALTVEDPGAVHVTTLDGYAPCLAVEGVVSSPLGVLYPSSDGLYLVQQGATKPVNVTENLISEREWREYVTDSFVACFYDSTYMAFFKKTDGTKGTMLIDFGESRQARMRYVNGYGTCITVVPHGRKIYYAVPTGNETESSIYEMYGLEEKGIIAVWHSKDFVFPSPVNFSSLIVESTDAEVPSDSVGNVNFWGGPVGQNMAGDIPFGGEGSDVYPGDKSKLVVATVIADNIVRFSQPVAVNKYTRLPAGFAARKWSVMVSTPIPVSRVAIGTGTEELR